MGGIGAARNLLRHYRPAALLVDSQRLLRRPLLEVDSRGRARLLSGEETPPSAVEEYPQQLWTAAPALAHVHLESHDAPSAEWPRDSFAAWADALLRWRDHSDRQDPALSAAASLEELYLAGCGAALGHQAEAGADGSTWPRATEAEGALRWTCLKEVFAPDPADASKVLAAMSSNSAGGWALHAPYSVSAELATALFRQTPVHHARRSIHLGEHPEERGLLAAGTGALADLFARRGRQHGDAHWPSPVDWLEQVAPGAQPQLLTVHCGDLKVEELRRLAVKQVHIVWCPGTHEYFQRPLPAFAAAGLPAPALGCDSRASNAALDPLREVRLARRLLPAYDAQQWWQAMTVTGAAALGGAVGPAPRPPGRAAPGGTAPGRAAHFQAPLGLAGGCAVLAFTDPGLHDAASVCDHLTAADGPAPLGPVRWL